MEKSQLVLGLLESVLGKGKRDRNSEDYAFHCPFCNHKKPKLIVNAESGQYNCWTCSPPTKGKTPVSLFKKMGIEESKMKEMKSYFPNDHTILKDKEKTEAVFLPKEFISMLENDNSLEYRYANVYLKNRRILEDDIKKYNIGYCKTGRYKNRIIIPSYGETGQLEYFVARSFEKEPYLAYDAPSVTKDAIIGFEYMINWNIPVILCEGAFDAIAIKRNAVPLFGKTLSKALMLRLVHSDVKTIYFALDNDAIKQSLHYAEELLNFGKEIYVIELEGKDPSDIGFSNMIKLLQKARPFTFTDLMVKKLGI